MAAPPKKKSLEAELRMALAFLHDLPPGAKARDVGVHASAVKQIWTLRFLLESHAYDTAVEPSDKHSARVAMREASIQMGEWAKRESAAKADEANDLLIEAHAHNATQAALASALAELDE